MLEINQCGLSSSSEMGGASNSSSCVQATLKMLYFMLFCCCTWSTAMVLPTEPLFSKHTATFNVTNPMYLQNIKPKKVLGVLEEAFREVLADVQNETHSITDEEEDRRRRRRRRMLQANRDMLTLMEKRKKRLKANLIKAKNNHFSSKTV
ncbi:unnamed protein product [Brugia pahangi]|uniref:BZIP domain-containing protein n=1 Tax=Brugia pahangi TaxID=6280 RepID=A0A0N4TQE1_BRUPA|nr:unnamed protein product [Brugia pahangi]